jgi:hypothetical protein
MAQKADRARNWKNYNKSLVNRGSITFWIDRKSIANWYESVNKIKERGRPKTYSDIAIVAILILKQIYHLKLRSSQGFTKSLFNLMNLNLKVPCYTQLCRRQATVKLPALPTLSGEIHMVIDSSGLKLFGEGEWKVRQHGWTKHRMWQKLHIGVDEKSQLIVAAELTKNDCGDDKKLPDLLRQYKGKLRQVSADGAYDSHDCYDVIASRGGIPTIPPQPNPRHKPKLASQIKRPRDKIVWEIQQDGRKEWKQQSGYHRRSLAETAFYRYKQLLSDKLSARNLENQKAEAMLGCHLLNKMTLELS